METHVDGGMSREYRSQRAKLEQYGQNTVLGYNLKYKINTHAEL
jgi:hypothetical protein